MVVCIQQLNYVRYGMLSCVEHSQLRGIANKRLQDLVQYILGSVVLFVDMIGRHNPFPTLLCIFPSLCQPLDQNIIKSSLSEPKET